MGSIEQNICSCQEEIIATWTDFTSLKKRGITRKGVKQLAMAPATMPLPLQRTRSHPVLMSHNFEVLKRNRFRDII